MKTARLSIFRLMCIGLCALSVLIAPLPVSRAQLSPCNNIMRGAVISEYSSTYGDDFLPENLIDGNQNTSWSAAEGDQQPFIVFDLGGDYEMGRMQLNGYTQANDRAYEGDSVRNFRLDASRDGQWSPVIEGESPLQDRLIEYAFPSPVVTNKVRLVLLSNHGGSSFEAAELAICGQRATTEGAKTNRKSRGKENPINAPLMQVQGDLPRDGQDEWKIDLKASQVISLELQATTYGARAALWNARRERLAEVAAYDEYVDTTFYGGNYGVTILEDGQYTVTVYSGIGPYTLQVNDGYFGQVAGTFSVGQVIQGNLAKHGFDRWLIELSALQVITLELEATTYGTNLRLYDITGKQAVLNSDAYDNFVGGALYVKSNSLKVLEGGLYMVRISNGIGPYTLRSTEGYFGYTVGTVAVGQTVQGTLQKNGFDRWLVALTAGQTVRIDLLSTTEGTLFKLFDPVGESFGNDVGAYERLATKFLGRSGEYRILTSGLYMIRVYVGVGEYSLTVTAN